MRTFIDTAPFIYLIEKNPEFVDSVKLHLLEGVSKGNSFVTSVITIMEFGVNPEKIGRNDLLHDFESLLEELHIISYEISRSIAESASKLRAKYEFLKGMDALQLSVAISTGCEQFLTNDKKLTRIEEIEVVLLDRKLL